ncbi:MAG: hypothetical protein CVU11_06930 [Bacteroidetes bacterium HGW-Bacteroidetes-6]|jgi:ABC-type phosphate transport system substrate-binding protein|nr:MAG: hypothetical protein CVU11_06930 [Bacteroidetes bacterium HGW-Bacteroidetes-6]
MNKILSLALVLIALLLASCGGNKNDKNNNPENRGTVNNDLEAGKITVGATEESFDLAQRLASTYVSQNTNIIIDVITVKPEEIESFIGAGSIQMAVTGGIDNPYPEYTSSLIACDLLTLCVNFNNPALQKMVMRGIGMTTLQSIFNAGSVSDWAQLFKKVDSAPLKALVGPEGSSSYKMAQLFLGGSFSKSVTSTLSDNEIPGAISANPGAIAFLSHRKAYNLSSKYRANGLYIIPIDLNNNNVADDNELIFDDLNMLESAYKKGNYPESLIRNHYFVYSEKATRADIVKSFVEYAEKEAANTLPQIGYFEPLKKQ